ncbi:DEAD/DEAH box helicase [Prolixibacter sp. SD074]|uniref:DEAD/DEAH box helicase n=1 Tax=Prolixibacter sp. SD074 TaxID=2652391 RepID=UPI00126C30C4|nr:DEAD/DEAH box helicase [Prolixibacter sp. SD074]GET30923.1 helicase [Prolixibacter sp. SD074]
MNIHQIVITQKKKLADQLNRQELALGEIIFNNGQCQILSQSASRYELIITDEYRNDVAEVTLEIEETGTIIPKIKNDEDAGWNKTSFACLLQVESEMHLLDPKEQTEHKKYTREGMVKRVLKERQQKAEKAGYHIRWADNIYGDHILTNERGIKYKVFLRDFETETGYSNSMDSRLNKLGTTKHIMFAFNALKENKAFFNKLDKTFPFVEIYCDPLNDYKISWYYPNKIPVEEQLLISRYFKNSNFIEDNKITGLLNFLDEASQKPHICVRPEVAEKIEAAFEKKVLEDLQETYTPDFSKIKADLYDYQKEGIQFALFRKTSIIADEMGLGKTIQAIGTAMQKKELFGFSKTLVVCPASLKEQWKKEVERFSDQKALVIQGTPDERAQQYKDRSCFFFIVNYETVLRDQIAINKAGMDFLILDEAQRAKNYETKTAASLKQINSKHKLAITGTPIENKLIDIFSIMSILDPEFFGPLWEFSYQHCLFDPEKQNKINGYYNLQKLNKQLEKVLIRREKRKVIDQLPNLRQIDIPVELSPLQADYHASYARGLAQIIHKKFLTPYDLHRMQLLLANMRMACDSTYLIDDETNESPKLNELKHILLDELDVSNKNTKIIIFSEWVKVHKLIGQLLRENNIGFVELNGKIPVRSRGELIRKFESNPQYKVFLSTEAGGSGLNLQVADTLINFELPWNPAKKNQRIGRIDRIGQKSNKLTIFNFITRNSIETQIAAGLLVKQSLFDGVLGDDARTNFVDFTTKGRSQFIQQLEEFISETERKGQEEELAVEPLGEEAITETEPEKRPADEIDFSGDDTEQQEELTETHAGNGAKHPAQTAGLETVMNSGMQFLSGLFKMTTGKEMDVENQTIEVNKETGEVTMKFKLPIGK